MKNSKNKISNSKRIFQFTLLFITFFTCNIIFAQFDIPKKPDFQTSVYDYANVLSATEKTQLEEKLVRYSDSTSTQIVAIIIEDLNGDNIQTLTPNWGEKWGIGDAEKDNGIVILLSKNDRKIWISPGYGTEVQLVAGMTGEIVRNVIIPEFKAGNYYNGLDKGTDAIIDVFKGKYKGSRKQNKGKDFPILPFIVKPSCALASRSETLPFVLQTFIPDSSSYNITPALSYPLYSRRFNPLTTIGYASLWPIYPTIPHIYIY